MKTFTLALVVLLGLISPLAQAADGSGKVSFTYATQGKDSNGITKPLTGIDAVTRAEFFVSDTAIPASPTGAPTATANFPNTTYTWTGVVTAGSTKYFGVRNCIASGCSTVISTSKTFANVTIPNPPTNIQVEVTVTVSSD